MFSSALKGWFLSALVVVTVFSTPILEVRGSGSEEQQQCGSYGLLQAVEEGCIDRVKFLIRGAC